MLEKKYFNSLSDNCGYFPQIQHQDLISGVSLFKLRSYFLEQFQVYIKTEQRKYRSLISITSPLSTSLTTVIHLLTVGERTLIHHYDLKSMVLLMVLYILWVLKTCIYHYSIIQNSFHCPKIPLCSACKSLSSHPWQPLVFLTVSIVLPFSDCYIVGIRLYVAFSDWLVSPNNMHSSFLHVFS